LAIAGIDDERSCLGGEMVEIPEWRIVDDDTWFAVQERFAANAREPPEPNNESSPRQ
jgi:hypothetical protein